MAMIKILDGFYVNSEDIITVEATPHYVTISIRQQTNTISFVPKELKEEVKGKYTEDAYRILQTWVDTFVGTINNQKKTETIMDSNAKPKRTIEEVKVDSERLTTLNSLNFALDVVGDGCLGDPRSWHWNRVNSDTIETVKGIFINDIKKKIKVLKEELNIE